MTFNVLPPQPRSGMVVKSVTVVRPSNSTPYTAKDAIDATVAAGFVFPNAGRSISGGGYIIKGELLTSQKTNVARHRLHLFNVAPTYIVDNGPYTLLYANSAIRIGQIDFPEMDTEDAANSTAASSLVVPGSGNLPLPFVCSGVTASLFAMLETLDAYTPDSQQSYTVKLTLDQN